MDDPDHPTGNRRLSEWSNQFPRRGAPLLNLNDGFGAAILHSIAPFTIVHTTLLRWGQATTSQDGSSASPNLGRHPTSGNDQSTWLVSPSFFKGIVEGSPLVTINWLPTEQVRLTVISDRLLDAPTLIVWISAEVRGVRESEYTHYQHIETYHIHVGDLTSRAYQFELTVFHTISDLTLYVILFQLGVVLLFITQEFISLSIIHRHFLCIFCVLRLFVIRLLLGSPLSEPLSTQTSCSKMARIVLVWEFSVVVNVCYAPLYQMISLFD